MISIASFSPTFSDSSSKLTISLSCAGFIWLVVSLMFFASGLLVGIAAFSTSGPPPSSQARNEANTDAYAVHFAEGDYAQQRANSEKFLGGTPF